MKENRPKGILIPIGGREDKTETREILCRLILETGKTAPRICLITLATGYPEEISAEYRKAFRAIGVTDIVTIHFSNRADADQPAALDSAAQCDAVLFSGGDQLKLCTLVAGTQLMALIHTRYRDEPDFVVAGTSAGAAAMSSTMIISGSSEHALIKGELELARGLDLIETVFIDTHFTQRGRFGRLIQTVTAHQRMLGLGLGEDTAVIIKQGEEMEVVGSGLVIVADGRSIAYTDLAEIDRNYPMTVEGIRLHVLGPGKKFLIGERRILH